MQWPSMQSHGHLAQTCETCDMHWLGKALSWPGSHTHGPILNNFSIDSILVLILFLTDTTLDLGQQVPIVKCLTHILRPLHFRHSVGSWYTAEFRQRPSKVASAFSVPQAHGLVSTIHPSAWVRSTLLHSFLLLSLKIPVSTVGALSSFYKSPRLRSSESTYSY